MKYSLAKVIISAVLVLSYFFLPRYGYHCGVLTWDNVLYPLSHANIWHLAANILCLWMIPCGLHLTTSFLLAVLCSTLPCFISEATMGFSGVLFAIVGISWGKVDRFKDMLWKNKWFLILPVFIPHVNAFIHFYCLLAGYFCGRYVKIGKGDWL